MKFNLNLFSNARSFFGLEIANSGYLHRNNAGNPVLVRTVDISIGFVFGWITVGFNTGREINLDEINKSLRDEVLKGKKIG